MTKKPNSDPEYTLEYLTCKALLHSKVLIFCRSLNFCRFRKQYFQRIYSGYPGRTAICTDVHE